MTPRCSTCGWALPDSGRCGNCSLAATLAAVDAATDAMVAAARAARAEPLPELFPVKPLDTSRAKRA